MGTDKATLVVRGRPLALIAADALREAGAAEIFAVGGDDMALRALGLEPVADRWPGEGPLGGIITALDTAAQDVVVVLACDVPEIEAAAVQEIVAALDPNVDAAVATAGGRAHPLIAAYRSSAGPTLKAAFDRGVRAVRAGMDSLDVRFVRLSHPEWARNVNFPRDLG